MRDGYKFLEGMMWNAEGVGEVLCLWMRRECVGGDTSRRIGSANHSRPARTMHAWKGWNPGSDDMLCDDVRLISLLLRAATS